VGKWVIDLFCKKTTMDKYKNFEDLKNNEGSESFETEYKNRMSRFLIFSPHAGGIEQGTSEICRQIAGNTYSYYLFAGNGNNCKRLHITSTNFHEPKLLGLLLKHKYAISIHGMRNEMKKNAGAGIFLGGLNRVLIEIATKILREHYFETMNNTEKPDSMLSGKDPGNITNKCFSGEGMQIEISEDLRSQFFQGDFKKKNGRKNTTNYFKNFCDAIFQSITIFEKTAYN
jgi:phage replication-related protein YjqB (UPF0714/DUF867 family)